MLEQILKELLEMVETANYKSNKIVELMKEIEEKDVIISEHDAVVAAKDKEIAELNAVVAAKDEAIAELNAALNALQAKYDADMNAINEQVQKLKNALGEVPKEPVE